MSNNSREIRPLQIAAMILYRSIPNVTLLQSSGAAFDILASTPGDELRFGINVVSSSYSNSRSYERYLDNLGSIDYSDKYYRIPILLMAVNESSGTAMIGIQVGWRFGRPTIFKKPRMMSVNSDNANKIIDAVKTMDDTIRMLSVYGMKIIKTINLESQEPNGMTHHASIVYLRDFTEEYKLKPKEIVNEREKFNRLLNENVEDEYPNDFMDNAILSMIQQQYPEARVKSSMMLFSTDLRNLQRLSQSIILEAKISVQPDITNMPKVALPFLNGINIVQFVVNVFVDVPFSQPFFENLSFKKIEPFNEWLNTYNNYSKVLTTLHSPTEYFL